MKRAGDILKDMGFRKDAPASLQEAFFRHLIRAANLMPNRNEETQDHKHQLAVPVQLEFSFDETFTNLDPARDKKKIS